MATAQVPPHGAAVDICAAICTRDRPALLRRALGALLAQTAPPAEVLVVDNAPQDQTTQTLVRAEFPTVRYVMEPVPGLDFARNRALAATKSDIVAFVDDDAVADAAWCRTLHKVFAENPSVAACIGRIDPLMLETEAQRLFEANGGFARGDRPIRLPQDAARPLYGRRAPLIAWVVHIGIGCNMTVRRQAALAVGGFDIALDLGAALPGGGDLDMLWRLLEAEYEVLYDPVALVWHEHRRQLDKVSDQIVGHQRAMVTVLTKAVTRPKSVQRFRVLAYLCWRLIKPGVRLLRRAVRRDPLPAALLLRMWWQCWLGLGTYPAAWHLAVRRTRGAGVTP
jgi:GT2 family glycosyltransferase